ncbi:FAD-dependent monooxygenase [Lachnellula willkommii]|uniref:FAD-dependent monooxygenase n=1 Tax=Lachnellula willkommii TaxID=215461 RepID=A0A559MBK1_9HELO|nr:FAD-dependent monooxygenase [Lachnellula willkommii]
MSIHDCTAEDPGEWTWMLMQTWRSDEPTGLAGDNVLPAMYERGKNFGYPFNEVFRTIPEGTKVWHNRLAYWPTKPWDSRGGLVTLAGDAAHPMTFHRGQGLNNAITDAADFLVHLREMKEHTPAELAAAVKRYEVELWPRGHEAVLQSHENTNAVHDWKTMMQSDLFTGGLAKLSKEEQAAKDEEDSKVAKQATDGGKET